MSEENLENESKYLIISYTTLNYNPNYLIICKFCFFLFLFLFPSLYFLFYFFLSSLSKLFLVKAWALLHILMLVRSASHREWESQFSFPLMDQFLTWESQFLLEFVQLIQLKILISFSKVTFFILDQENYSTTPNFLSISNFFSPLQCPCSANPNVFFNHSEKFLK